MWFLFQTTKNPNRKSVVPLAQFSFGVGNVSLFDTLSHSIAFEMNPISPPPRKLFEYAIALIQLINSIDVL